MKTMKRKILTLLMAMLLILGSVSTVYAAGDGASAGDGADGAAGGSTGKAVAAAVVVGIAASAGAIAMGMAISKSVDGISRQPEAEDKIRTTLMLGLVFVETAIIYALIVAILIIFVL